MKFDKKYISGKYPYFVVIAFCVAGFIVYHMVKTMTVDRDKFMALEQTREKDSLIIKPTRGNILSADGQLMASSLPNYAVYIDFLSGLSREGQKAKQPVNRKDSAMWAMKDSLFHAGLDSICIGLNEICPNKTVKEYKRHLLNGWEKKSRYYELCNQRLDYIQYNKLMSLPFFRLSGIDNASKFMVGLTAITQDNRVHPFGSLAKRTLGDLYAAKDSARYGLELAFDSILRGKEGICHRKKTRSVYLDVTDIDSEDGYDVVSTIDVNMQDICETALRNKLKELEAEWGVVVLMEAATGDVKAITNLDRIGKDYYEVQNRALSTMMEPGSTFKTASIMVALDDGKIKITDIVDTKSGVFPMYDKLMKDHNWRSGGCHVIDVPMTLIRSSNIGVGRLINENYHNEPAKFIEGLHRVGIAEPLDIPFQGTANPKLLQPGTKYWSAITLPWMAIGYSTQIPPISTVTFYNAIANGGKMMRPRFVKAFMKDGQVVEEFPPEVMKEEICKPQTLEQIKSALYQVVHNRLGVGKGAKSDKVSISGKTGTAQVSHGKRGYGAEYLVSFCGYFPSENPKYTCIVAIRKNGQASGGGMAGPVFSTIAEQITYRTAVTDLSQAQDSLSVFVPDVKRGNLYAAKQVLDQLDITIKEDVSENTWGEMYNEGKTLRYKMDFTHRDSFPDLTGMGARDAIFAIESRGMRAKVKGIGKVVSQSVRPGGRIVKNKVVTIEMN